jgi:hypothetical protein
MKRAAMLHDRFTERENKGRQIKIEITTRK